MTHQNIMPGTSTTTRFKNVQQTTCGKCEKTVARLGNFISIPKFRILGIGLGYKALHFSGKSLY